MTAFASDLMAGLLGDPEIAALIDDRAAIRAMLRVEAALAEAGAEAGVIPRRSAEAIMAAAGRLEIAPAELAAGMARDGVPVPALVARLRDALPEDIRGHVHFGASSQDIVDTAMVLTSREALAVLRARLAALVDGLAALAALHARDLVAGRTRHQLATPTTFGLIVAGWALPLARHVERIDALGPRFALLSLGGSSGNLAALGAAGPEVEARMAAALGLGLPDLPWHAARDGVAELGSVLALVAGTLGKIGADLLVLAQDEVAEARPGAGGGSSTMPHKANPVAAELLVTLARVAGERAAALMAAVVTTNERDGSAWTSEWIALPDLFAATGAATRIAADMLAGLQVDREAMAARVLAAPGRLHSEPAVFALAAVMPRGPAEAHVAAAAKRAAAEGRHLVEALRDRTGAAIDWEALHRLDAVTEAAAGRVARALVRLGHPPGDSP